MDISTSNLESKNVVYDIGHVDVILSEIKSIEQAIKELKQQNIAPPDYTEK